MQMATQFQQFVDGELARSAEVLDQIVSGTLEQLVQPREGMLSPEERPHYAALIELLRNRRDSLRDAFVKTLYDLVQVNLSEAEGQGAEGVIGDVGGTLTLMDENQVQADIEISRAAQLIDATGEWELRELQSFTSALKGQSHVTAESNPFRPLCYSRALWDGICAVTSVSVQRNLFLRVASGVASGVLKRAWAAGSSRIEALGYSPSIYRTVVIKPSPSMSRLMSGYGAEKLTGLDSVIPHLPEMPATLARVRDQLASRARQGQGSAFTNDFPMLPRIGFTASAEFLAALGQFQTRLKQMPVSAESQSDLAVPRLRDHVAALQANTEDDVDQQIIELMGRFFDVVLLDPQVHVACRPLLARLQASVLYVALADASMMLEHKHPAWRLMDELCSAFALYGQGTDYRCAALLTVGQQLVEDITQGSDPSAPTTAYERALAKLHHHQHLQREAELLVAKSTVDELLLAEKRDHLQRKISKHLVEQMVPLRVSPVIRRFVTGDWARVLAHAILRHGEQSETTISYLKAVDDLIWSLNPPNHPKSRQRLLTMLPTLLHRITVGMTSIDLPAAEQQAVLDELVLAHRDALRPGQKGVSVPLAGLNSATISTTDQIGQVLSQELPDPQTIGPSFADSLIELVSMDTVPVDMIHTHPPGDDSNFNSIVETLRPGSNVRMFLRGRWTRAQLLWYSSQGTYYLFSGEAPGRTHSVTQAALERLSGEKLLLPLEDRPLSQRALRTIQSELT